MAKTLFSKLGVYFQFPISEFSVSMTVLRWKLVLRREGGTFFLLYRLSLHQPASKINPLRRKKGNKFSSICKLEALDLPVGYSTGSEKTSNSVSLLCLLCLTKFV